MSTETLIAKEMQHNSIELHKIVVVSNDVDCLSVYLLEFDILFYSLSLQTFNFFTTN